ncbi:MAG: 5-methyltetrahydropteroyltriglutamate--homocysteine S-methyltransferase [Alphaproteobacteria bacterium]|nr:5-methyltetrahydropteroyltriglutamate--homocysteine S-methyltransferase [Alphaproteobacteria bacterium]
MAERANGPPFRAEHVGSFVRPDGLLEAARAHKAGSLDGEAYRRVQDDCIREIVAFQDDIGMPSITDGEFRRRVWSAGFTDAVEGMGVRAEGTLAFKTDAGEVFMPPSPFAEAKLRRKGRIVTDDYEFVAALAPRGVPKVTIASPAVMHFYLGPKSFEPSVYADRDAYFDVLAGIYRDEVAELAAAGCAYLQIDDTAMVCNCDEAGRAAVRARGEDPDELTAAYVDLINRAIADRPAGMTVGLHTCRGNLKGAWMAEGGYEPIAERLFNGLDVDAFFLEYDSPRAGDFAPLRHLPAGKTAVLGLISTKTPELEKKDDLKRRIDEAAAFVPLERLALSPQCGFSSGGGGGQVVTQDDTRRKLELVVEVAREVWG